MPQRRLMHTRVNMRTRAHIRICTEPACRIVVEPSTTHGEASQLRSCDVLFARRRVNEVRQHAGTLDDSQGFKGYLDAGGKVGTAVIKRQVLYVAGGGCLQQSRYA